MLCTGDSRNVVETVVGVCIRGGGVIGEVFCGLIGDIFGTASIFPGIVSITVAFTKALVDGCDDNAVV